MAIDTYRDAAERSLDASPAVLRPFIKDEVLTTPEAVQFLAERGFKRAKTTLRNWAPQHHVGRKVGGTLHFSKVALLMVVEGDDAALKLYLDGDRRSPVVRSYFLRLGIAL